MPFNQDQRGYEVVRFTIIPNEPVTGQPTLVQGTRVLDSEGKDLRGVFRVELLAECNSIWKAVIHMHATVAEVIEAEGIVEPHYIECSEDQAMKVVKALALSLPGSFRSQANILESMERLVGAAYSGRRS